MLDGNSAVVLSEAGIATHAVLGGSSPCAQADAVWLGELEHGGTNLFGEALSAQTTEGPRGIIAAATGLALAGRRATAFLSGTDIAAAQDLLISAAGKHVPLVLHVGTRAAAAHGAALGSGHETVHLSADTGFFMLFASNVQEVLILLTLPGASLKKRSYRAWSSWTASKLRSHCRTCGYCRRPRSTILLAQHASNRSTNRGAKAVVRRDAASRSRLARPRRTGVDRCAVRERELRARCPGTRTVFRCLRRRITSGIV